MSEALWKIGGKIRRGKNRSTRRKTRPKTTFSPSNST